MRGLAGGLLVLVVLVGLAGCGQPEDVPGGSGSPEPGLSPPLSSSASPPGPSVTASPTASRRHVVLKVTRTGGFAGVQHRLEVAEDRTWVYTGDGQRQTGRLTGSQMDRLKALATDRRLHAEAEHRDKRICHDGFTYDVTVGSFSITAVECGRFEERPALTALVEFLKDVTPL